MVGCSLTALLVLLIGIHTVKTRIMDDLGLLMNADGKIRIKHFHGYLFILKIIQNIKNYSTSWCNSSALSIVLIIALTCSFLSSSHFKSCLKSGSTNFG